MDTKMKITTIFAGLILFFPLLSQAHLISITPTRTFPATASSSSTSTATFLITNITSQTSVTAVNVSNFPSNSGLSVTSTTCGSPMSPGQTCTMNLSLAAGTPGSKVSSSLNVRALPAIDVVQYPINVTVTGGMPNITLTQLSTAGSPLPALRDPIVASHNNLWLIMGGSLGTIHDFSYNSTNKIIYVYNPNTQAIYSSAITALPAEVQKQLSSVDTEFLQDGDTLYIIGGYYNPGNSPTDYTTLQTITAINVPNMVNAIINNTSLAGLANYNISVPQFKVTGGQLGKIGNDFYLAYGMDCEGVYNNSGNGSCNVSQTYTNSVYQFSTSPTLSSITIDNSVTQLDAGTSGWRRRDYTLAPVIIGGAENLLSIAGPFTLNVDVWTNDILIGEGIIYNNNFHTQQANQYSASRLSMVSQNTSMSYLATFSGITTLYWGANGLVSDTNNIPWGNVLDLLSTDASGNVQEYANITPLCAGQPLSSCLYMGVAAVFIPVSNSSYFDSREILQLDQLPQNTSTLVGYVYGGMISTDPNPFFNGPNLAHATNQVYEIYVTPTSTSSNQWVNITNLY